MDASKITQLLQKQNTRYINRCQTQDSSTLTWKNTIQSSKYIQGVPTCDNVTNTNVPTQTPCSDNSGICNFGGQGKSTTLMTGSPQIFPSVLAGAKGSASAVYSSESIVLQKAGKQSCGVPGTNPAPTNSYVVLPECYCSNSNYSSTVVNNNSNPYLPQFDTYYRFKNPMANCNNMPDQNQKHFVKICHSRFPDANNGVSVNCTECQNSPNTCNGCVLQQ